MKFEVEHRFPAAPEKVVEVVLDQEFQREMHAALGYLEWTEERRDEAGGHLARTLRIVPPITLPAFMARVVGNAAGYREEQEWTPDRRGYSWKVRFDSSERIAMAGRCSFTAEGAGCLRVITTELTASFPLVGGRVEAHVRDEMLRTQGETARRMADRLASRP